MDTSDENSTIQKHQVEPDENCEVASLDCKCVQV